MNEFRVGDWWLIDTDRNRWEFYVMQVAGDSVKFGSQQGRSIGGGLWVTIEELKPLKTTFLGHGRPKWYWRFLPWRDLVCPYYLPQ